MFIPAHEHFPEVIPSKIYKRRSKTLGTQRNGDGSGRLVLPTTPILGIRNLDTKIRSHNRTGNRDISGKITPRLTNYIN